MEKSWPNINSYYVQHGVEFRNIQKNVKNNICNIEI
jgi:hypothetical protein